MESWRTRFATCLALTCFLRADTRQELQDKVGEDEAAEMMESDRVQATFVTVPK